MLGAFFVLGLACDGADVTSAAPTKSGLRFGMLEQQRLSKGLYERNF